MSADDVDSSEGDKMLERAQKVTRYGKTWTAIEYARYADDLVVLVNDHPRERWLQRAVMKRLREELAKPGVELNEAKTRVVDLAKGQSFDFLGFEFRRVLTRRGRWMPLRQPQKRKRTELLRRLKVISQRHLSQPVQRVIEEINPILRGWVGYFANGNSSRCLQHIRDWVEKKIRRHLMRARARQGFGWKRWSREWMYSELGLFADYRVRYPGRLSAAAPVR